MRRVTFTVLIIAVLVTVGVGMGVVTAQEDSNPVAFEGSVVDGDGNAAPDGTTIVAIPENGTSGETTTEAGSYGGGFDALTVGANESDTVTVSFYIDGADGSEADESPETFDVEQGQHTHDLTFSDVTFESSGDDDDDDGSDDDSSGGSDDSSTAGGPAGGTDDGTDDDTEDDDSTDDDSADDEDDTDVDDEDDSAVEDDGADDEADDETAESDDEDDDTAIEADDGEEEPADTGGEGTDETDGAVDDETDDEAPGFGIGAALIALSGLFVFARRLGPSRSTE